jgi:hypothetical protein
MTDIKRQENLIGFCGAYCGECGMYRGRIYARIAKDFLEILRASDYADWLPNVMKLDFSFEDLLKGLEYFSKKDAGCYCQEPCKNGGGAPCKNRPCAGEKGVEICYECEDFPCEHFDWILEKHPDRLEDYERFKKLGLEGWLRFHAKRAKQGYAHATGKYYARPRSK